MRVRLSLALFLLIAHSSISQTNLVRTNARSLKLEECIDLALANNLDLQIQRLTTRATDYTLTSAYGACDPAFSLFARRDFLSQPSDIDFKKTTPDFPYRSEERRVGKECRS